MNNIKTEARDIVDTLCHSKESHKTVRYENPTWQLSALEEAKRLLSREGKQAVIAYNAPFKTKGFSIPASATIIIVGKL